MIFSYLSFYYFISLNFNTSLSFLYDPILFLSLCLSLSPFFFSSSSSRKFHDGFLSSSSLSRFFSLSGPPSFSLPLHPESSTANFSCSRAPHVSDSYYCYRQPTSTIAAVDFVYTARVIIFLHLIFSLFYILFFFFPFFLFLLLSLSSSSFRQNF